MKKIAAPILCCFLVFGICAAGTADQQYQQAKSAFEKNDIGTAIDLLQKAAGQGHADAQFNLGILHHNGQGVPQDDQIAFEWFGKAAEAGHGTAQSNLGLFYYYGVAVPSDPVTAHMWLRLSVAAGVTGAQSNLDHIGGELSAEQLEQSEEMARKKLAEIRKKAAASK